ncbi:MAG: phenylalanine 4-monooxygenase [Sphingomonadaceae bacterium]|nr:phenylalanine 4-monooxygenase [Sphingomonadaceae bacterium]
MAAPPLGPPPPGAASDWTIPQRWADYTADEHAVWSLLATRQREQLRDRACSAYLAGLELMTAEPGIPDLARLSDQLRELTGWEVVCVPGLVPERVFFEHLARRRFVAGRFIRRMDQLDYLEQPDIFHDVFGHVPLLADPTFAAFLEAYGRKATEHPELTDRLARLYWYSIEFGLVREDGAIKLYGAGIVSSHGESEYALDSAVPNRLGFDLRRILRTDYRTDDLQESYFVLDDFGTLLDETLATDFVALSAELDSEPVLPPGALLPGDRVIHRGVREAIAA